MIFRATAAVSIALLVSFSAYAQTKPASHNMTLVGYSDLQARSAYQPSIHRQGDRYIAYIGHHGGTSEIQSAANPSAPKEYNGTSIVDVTDPKHPKYLFHIPGEPGVGEQGGAQMTRICDGKDLPNAANKNGFYLLRTFGNSAHEVWDVSDPSKPALLTRLDGLKGTHKNFWECDTGSPIWSPAARLAGASLA